MSSETSLPLGPLSPREQNRDIVWMMLPLLAVSCYLYGARPAVMCLVGSITAAFCPMTEPKTAAFRRCW